MVKFEHPPSTRQPWHPLDFLLALLGFGLALSVHGAIPFVLSPTLLQLVWSGGFAQSIANQGWFALYATDFGAPLPAPIAFGLSGVWVTSVLIRIGLPVHDAYTLMVAAWLAVAFAGAFALARRLGADRKVALVLATSWLTLPMVWAHAAYSMLALGMALLPTYFLSALALLQPLSRAPTARLLHAMFHLGVAMVAVFMDGYTFVMYVVSSSILVLFSFLMDKPRRRHILVTVMPIHALSVALAYLAYKTYVGEMPFQVAPLDFFRGWAVDLHYLFVPSLGIHALFDGLSWSVSRRMTEHYGDNSVWNTTFALPLVVLGVVALFGMRTRKSLPAAAICIALLGLYMALGPSVKFMSAEYAQLHSRLGGLMPAQAGIMETGNAWISSYVPGFNAMRASYRWLALSFLGLWLLVALWMSQLQTKRSAVALLTLAALITAHLPNLPKFWQQKQQFRHMAISMDRDIASSVAPHKRDGEQVVFLPTGNDFLVNHIAARHTLHTYNIGGDKNLEMARAHWPEPVRNAYARPGLDMTAEIRNILLRDAADVVIVPHFDLLAAAQEWPCQAYSPLTKGVSAWTDDQKFVTELSRTIRVPFDKIRRTRTVYIRSPQATSPKVVLGTDDLRPLGIALSSIEWRASVPLSSPVELSKYKLLMGTRQAPGIPGAMFPEGWHAMEDHHIWSRQEAKLVLKAPPQCSEIDCEVLLTARAFGASEASPKEVLFTNVQPECPDRMRETIQPLARLLAEDPLFDVLETELFTSIRIRSDLLQSSDREALLSQLARYVSYPVMTKASEPSRGSILLDGWHAPEPASIWSQASAGLSLPVPPECKASNCHIKLKFSAFGASEQRPVTVVFRHSRTGKTASWVSRSADLVVAELPLAVDLPTDDWRIQVDRAASPSELGLSEDTRVLGIALQEVDIQPSTGSQPAPR